MNYSKLLEDIRQEVTHFFHRHEKAGFVYHNLEHTIKVVTHASDIAAHYQCNEHDSFVVVSAAWFHDTGYYIQDGSDHERRGAEKAEEFLKDHGVDQPTIDAVKGCIMATAIPQVPKNLLEQIVCDADLYHLGTADFEELNKRMRKESEWRLGRKIPKHEWRMAAIRLLESHHYQTDYGREMLEQKKKDNIDKLKQKEEPETPEFSHPGLSSGPIEDGSHPPPVAGEHTAAPRPEKKQKNDRPDRGIETMFRISSNNHQRLSDMADNKAHIMITTTSIIISVLLSLLLRKLEDYPNLIFPTILLLLVCMITMVFSILATRPSLPSGRFTPEDIREKKVNLLFFGNFYRMKYEEYQEGMVRMMNDRDFLYGSLTMDLYSQGIVLGRKYRLLRIAYNVFMFGIVLSVLAYVIASFFFGR
jgi:predicted metal-dependent HD superfamily phosphohydrolase